MKHAKGWEVEEDDYVLFTSPSNKKGPKKAFKGCCGYCGEFGHKAADSPNKKSNQNKGQKSKTHQKKKQHGKRDSKSKGHLGMSKIKSFNCGEYGHFVHDCLKACDNANIAQESEQKGKMESMLNLDSTSPFDVEELQFSLFLISCSQGILNASLLSRVLLLKNACLHVSFTAYENFNKLSKMYCHLVLTFHFPFFRMSECRNPTLNIYSFMH